MIRRFPKFGEATEAAVLLKVAKNTGGKIVHNTFSNWRKGTVSPTLIKIMLVAQALELNREEVVVFIEDLWALAKE